MELQKIKKYPMMDDRLSTLDLIHFSMIKRLFKKYNIKKNIECIRKMSTKY
jgi:hypothetical protein